MAKREKKTAKAKTPEAETKEPPGKFVVRVFGPYLAAFIALQAYFAFFHPEYLKLTHFLYAFVAMMGVALLQEKLNDWTAPYRQKMAERIKEKKAAAEKR